MADKFEELRTFVTMVETGGISTAAERLSIAKSAVSSRLAKLEERLGAKLVQRSTRTFVLTDAGTILHRDAQRLLEDLAAAERRVSEAPEPERPPIVLVAEPSLVIHLLAGPLAAFLAERPEVRVKIQSSGNPEQADIIVAAGQVAGGRRLVETEMMLVASPVWLKAKGGPDVVAHLEKHVTVTMPRDRDTERTGGSGAANPARVPVEVPDGEEALALVIAGAGLAWLPGYICQSAIRKGTLAVIRTSDSPKKEIIAIGTGARCSLMATALIDHLVTSLDAADPGKSAGPARA